ncbi:SAM-dependent methyltransferase [Paenibacillus albiflavus]|uniref:SAM-dependent methyltransferase n=1 Tax=Paenibacillus albiflavus TaxID=2545760 RepID=A0A4V2WPW9_9BACL|nr:SAM-dependent methyltransferase [Paenibacillus albiflavus]TCZ81032.1 SAM-dependent methyltransferase [Paenibacillus albiflavus]
MNNHLDKDDTTSSVSSTWIGTANHGFAVYAVEELRRLFPSLKFSYIVPSEIVQFTIGLPQEEVLQLLHANEPMFLRHLHPVHVEIERTEEVEAEAELAAICSHLEDLSGIHSGAKIAIQARKSEGSNFNYSPSEIKKALDAVLIDQYRAEAVVRDADQIISVFVMADSIYMGISRPTDNLSDWSGGAIRFRKEDGQISRAKFKLLEAEYAFGLDFTQYRHAIDLGAAPGGWTSLLLERGLHVTAIDPGALDSSIIRHKRLTFYRRNAANVKLDDNNYDLLVCDMSWNPKQTGKLLKDLLYALQSGGTIILTVKLMHKKPFQTIKELLRELEPELSLQHAKQLFHNREELTLFLIKN